MHKLNVGCGKHIMPAPWINLDMVPAPGVDLVCDIGRDPIPRFPDNSMDEIFASHVIEHVPNTLHMMQELHRVAADGAICVIRCPHGNSDNAWEDPTHVRPMYPHSFYYFSQLAYHAADYGYRGDWAIEEVNLILNPTKFSNPNVVGMLLGVMDPTGILKRLDLERNLVREMVVRLRAVKPIRLPDPKPFELPLRLTLDPE